MLKLDKPQRHQVHRFVQPSSIGTIARRSFGKYGALIASHQILALLFSSVVIWSLFFPTLSLYFSPDGPASQVARRGRGSMVWELDGIKRQGLVSSEDEVCWDRLAQYYDRSGSGKKGKVVRMEQVLISPSSSSNSGALSKRTLHQTIQLQAEISRRLLSGHVPGLTCIRSISNSKECAVSSPVNYWESESDLLADFDVHRTLSLPPVNSTSSALPLTLTNTLVGMGRDKSGTVKGAHYLAMTFYLEDTTSELVLEGIGTVAEEAARTKARRIWRRLIRDVVAGKDWQEKDKEAIGKIGEGRGSGRRVILKHLPDLKQQENHRLLEDMIFALAYVVVGIYIVWKIRRFNRIHSKVGLAFTGAIELVATGIISISICWLFGLSVALLPWKIMPFLILVLGIDNMFVLINAIDGTDVALPVPARVAAGMESVGIYITLTLLFELAFFGVLLQMIDIPVIRQSIIFSSVALAVDYFMEMTLFATVLSIDIQRLELAELLSQDHSTGHRRYPTAMESKSSPPVVSKNPFARYWSSFHYILGSRIARTITFILLAVIDTLLYVTYGSDHYLPAFCSETALLTHKRPLLSPSLSSEFGTSASWSRRVGSVLGENIRAGAGEKFWQLINPANSTSVHVYVEPVLVVKFYSDTLLAPESAASTIGESLWWVELFKTFVAPIFLATLVLYIFLRYLLRGSDLIDVEREQASDAWQEKKRLLGDAKVKIRSLRGGHSADVELMASSGTALVSWSGLSNHIAVWKSRTTAGFTTFEASRLDLSSSADSSTLLTNLSIDVDSRFCLAIKATGVVLLWDLEDEGNMIEMGETLSSSPIVHLSPSSPLHSDPHAPPTAAGSETTYGFITIHADGSAQYWNCSTRSPSFVLSPASSTFQLRSFIIPLTDATLPTILARTFACGNVELYHCVHDARTTLDWQPFFHFQVTTLSDPITTIAVSAGRTPVSESPSVRGIVAIGTHSGAVSLYDVERKSRLCAVTELDGSVQRLRLLRPSNQRCESCRHPVDDLIIICSTGHLVSILRLALPPTSTSNSSSSSSTPTCSCHTRSAPLLHRLPSVSHPTLRASSKKLHRTSLSRTKDDPDSSRSHSPDDSTSTLSTTSPQLRTVEELNVAVDERGGWELVGKSIIGVRKTAKQGVGKSNGSSRSSAWEVWSVDLDGGIGQWKERTTPLDLQSTNSTSLFNDSKRRNTSTSPSSSVALSLVNGQHEDSILPFSRARPIIFALHGSLPSVAIGLGNQIALLTPLVSSKRLSNRMDHGSVKED